MRYRAVIFDLGGVVLDAPLQILADFESDNNLPKGFINQLIRDGGDLGPWQQFERGEIEPSEFCDRFEALAAATGHAFKARALLEAMASRMTIRADVIKAVRKLRDEEYLVAALTNNWRRQSGITLPPELAPTMKLFDVVVESALVGVRKPDAAIYQMVLEKATQLPSRIQLKRITTLDGNDASSLASLVAVNHKVVRQFFEQVKDILGVDLLGTLSSTGVN